MNWRRGRTLASWELLIGLVDHDEEETQPPMTEQQQTCPRRLSDWGPWERTEGLDRWVTDRGMAAQVGPSCDFCGSLHPDRFMELVRDGWIVGPTDKRYKAYLESPLSDDEKAARRDRWMASDGFARALRELGERDGKTPEQIQADLDTEWERQGSGWLHGNQTAKFYYQHLSDAQRGEFIELVNTGRMRIGYPGHLYVLPFFAEQRADTDTGSR